MKILIAEDDVDISESYKDALESRKHEVILAKNGEECLKRYNERYNEEMKHTKSQRSKKNHNYTPFDAVILDYKMPKKDGLQVAKEILELKPDQRIIFASAYLEEALEDSIKQLKRVVELMQKPFGVEALVDTLEDKEIYSGLKTLMVGLKEIEDLNPTKNQLKKLFEALKEIQKHRTY
jgi:CheY-like chemotaxis protein